MSNLDLSLYRSIEALADNNIPNPILRIDFFLHAVITGEECNIEPVTKTEEYLYALATGDESRLEFYDDSITLLEEYLDALRTGDTSNLREPRTREEIILYQAITGEDLGVEPVSRIETYLSMLQNAGGLDYILSTSTNASIIPLTNSINGRARLQEMCGDTYVNVSNSKDEFSVTHKFSTGEGNDVKLEGSKDGLVEVESVKGNTLVNLFSNTNTLTNDTRIVTLCLDKKDLFKPGVYTAINNTGRKIVYAIYSKDTNSWIREYVSDSSMALTLGDNEYIYSYQGLFSNGWSTNDVELFKKSCIILEGDYTNKPIPSYFEGMKSSFEDKVVPENILGEKVTNTTNKVEYSLTKNIKPNTTYTVYLEASGVLYCGFQKDSNWVKYLSPSQRIHTITTDDNVDINKFSLHSSEAIGVDKCFLVEGNYTNFDFSNYDPTKAGKYRVDYKVTGKNKFDKSKTLDGYEISNVVSGEVNKNDDWFVTDFIPVIPNTTYSISGKDNGRVGLCYDKNKQLISNLPLGCTERITIPNNVRYIKVNGLLTQKDTFQLEEGEVATPYEPYKESVQTLYLDEPLYKDNELCVHEGKLGYWKNMHRCVFDGINEMWLKKEIFSNQYIYGLHITDNLPKHYVSCNNNKYPNRLPQNTSGFTSVFTVNAGSEKEIRVECSFATLDDFIDDLRVNNLVLEYPLAEPIFVPILENTPRWILESFNSCSVHFETNVPISSISFKEYVEPISALKPNQRYNIRFECNKADVPLDISLGGTLYNITSSLVNNITITTPFIIEDCALRIDGQGVKCKNVVVSEHNVGDKYFEGMKSCGQDDENGHKIDIVSMCDGYINTISNSHHIKSIYPFDGNEFDKIKPYLQYFNLVDSYSVCNNLYDYYYTDKDASIWLNLGTFDSVEALKVLNKRIAEGEGKISKHTIQLPQPLRGLPNGVRDRIVYLDENTTPIAPEGKGLYLEKNVDEFIPNTIGVVHDSGLSDNVCLFKVRDNCRINCTSAISSVFKYVQGYSLQTVPFDYYVTIDGHMWVAWTKTSNVEDDKRDFINYVNNNNVKVCCALQTPIYTKISDVNFECYENATVYVDSGAVVPTKTVIRYPYKQPALFSL